MNITHLEEHAMDRMGSIGGSDAGAICGVNKYKSAFEVWLEKMGQAQEREQTCSMMLGTFFEPMIADKLSEAIGKKVIKQFDVKTQSKDYDWMTCRVDGLIEGERSIVECKTTFSTFSDLSKGIIPDAYLLQCQHNMAVHEADTCFLAYYIIESSKAPQFNFVKIDRDDELIKKLIKIEKSFWFDNVVAKSPPSIDYHSETTAELLKQLHPKATIQEKKDVSSIDHIIESYTQINKQLKELEAKKEAYANEIKHTIGDHLAGESTKFEVIWKPQEATRLDTIKLKVEMPAIFEQYCKTSSTRVLRIKEI